MNRYGVETVRASSSSAEATALTVARSPAGFTVQDVWEVEAHPTGAATEAVANQTGHET